MSVTMVTGCKKEDKKAETNKKTEDKTISVDDDNVEALHKILMEETGNAALKHATVSDYTAMQLEVEEQVEVTEEVLQSELDDLLKQYPYVFSGQAVSGDTINIDYTGYKEGETFQGGSDTGFDLMLGSGGFIPGFEEQLVGISVGETKTIDVTFPEEYPNQDGTINEELAGKPVQFKVTMNYMKKADGTIAELTEQWVAAYLNEVGGTVTDASVEGFKSYLKTQLEQQEAERRTNNVNMALMMKLMNELLELKDVPKEQTTYYTNYVKNNIEANIISSGGTIEEYLSQIGMTKEEYEEEVKSMAEDTLKERYAIIYIGEKEKLLPTEEEYTAQLQEFADYNSMTLDEFRSSYQKSYQSDIYFIAYEKKVMEKLLETAVITPPQATSDVSGEALSTE